MKVSGGLLLFPLFVGGFVLTVIQGQEDTRTCHADGTCVETRETTTTAPRDESQRPIHSSSSSSMKMKVKMETTFESRGGVGGGGTQEKGMGLLGGIGKAARGLLPTKWTNPTEKQLRERQHQKELKDDISQGIMTLFDQAPRPVRALASMFVPLISSALVWGIQSLSEQSEQMQLHLQEAQQCILNHPQAVQALGRPIRFHLPSEQSSLATVENGVQQSKFQAKFQVVGSRQTGTVGMRANQNGIQTLFVQLRGGRLIHIPPPTETIRIQQPRQRQAIGA